MREHFLEQLEKHEPITKERISQLKGKSFYSDYRVGDKMFYFLSQEFVNINKIKLVLRTITERELDLLKEDFKFIRISNNIPIFERINKFTEGIKQNGVTSEESQLGEISCS